MADKIIKSVLWLSGFTALGYGLLLTCTQSPAEIDRIKKDLRGVEKSPSENLKKKQQFVNVLQSASTSNEPLYRLDKEGIDRELKKQ